MISKQQPAALGGIGGPNRSNQRTTQKPFVSPLAGLPFSFSLPTLPASLHAQRTGVLGPCFQGGLDSFGPAALGLAVRRDFRTMIRFAIDSLVESWLDGKISPSAKRKLEFFEKLAIGH